jgi:hypothetical protein
LRLNAHFNFNGCTRRTLHMTLYHTQIQHQYETKRYEGNFQTFNWQQEHFDIFLMLMKVCDILRIILLNLTHYRNIDVCDLIDSVYDTESTISTHNL